MSLQLYGKGHLMCRIVVGKPERKRPLGRPGLDNRIILK
jgi:hypothetical protein